MKNAQHDADSLHQIAGSLDQFYIPAQYPNGLHEAAPFEVYTKKQAEEAIEGAAKLIALAERIVEKL